MGKIRVLRSGAGDWEGLYVDGVLKAQGHSLQLRDVIDFILPGVDFKMIEHPDEYLESYGGHCPEIYPDELG